MTRIDKAVIWMVSPLCLYAVWLNVAEPLGRLPNGTALSSYGSSPQAVSPVPASIDYRKEARQ